MNDELREVLESSDSLASIVYLAVYNAVKDTLCDAEMEDALTEGVRAAMAEQLEWLQTKFAWLPKQGKK